MKHLKRFNESISKSNPKFRKGDKVVMLPTEARFYWKVDGELKYPAKMLADYEHEEVVSDANWYSYDLHPEGGYWEYELSQKANPCPEDFLALYDENAEYYDKPKYVK